MIRAKEMKPSYEWIREHIEKANASYKVRAKKHMKHLEFSLEDLVWLHLRKERFLSITKNKLIAGGDGPLKIIKRVGDNAYKI